MGLTWRDMVSSVAIVAIVLMFAVYKAVPSAPVISSAASASMIALVLGACCAVCAAIDLHTRQLSRLGVIYRRITTVAGAIALGPAWPAWSEAAGRRWRSWSCRPPCCG